MVKSRYHSLDSCWSDLTTTRHSPPGCRSRKRTGGNRKELPFNLMSKNDGFVPRRGVPAPAARGQVLPFVYGADLLRMSLLRSYRPQDWPAWFKAVGIKVSAIRGTLFDSSLIMVQPAIQGAGIALVPYGLFRREIETEQLVRSFPIDVHTDRYWLTRLKSRPPNQDMRAFRAWVLDQFRGGIIAD